jgi:hypothetical protein
MREFLEVIESKSVASCFLLLLLISACTAKKDVVAEKHLAVQKTSYLIQLEVQDASTGEHLPECYLEYSFMVGKNECSWIFHPLSTFDGAGTILFVRVASSDGIGYPIMLRVSSPDHRSEATRISFDNMQNTSWFNTRLRRTFHFVAASDPAPTDAPVNYISPFRLNPLRSGDNP